MSFPTLAALVYMPLVHPLKQRSLGMRDAMRSPLIALLTVSCVSVRALLVPAASASTRVAAAAAVHDWHGVRLSDGSTTAPDDTFRGSFTAGRAIEEGKMAIVVPNVATAERSV